MRTSFNYRLSPTKRQERVLSEELEEVRWLWNTPLAERKQAWEERQETIDSYDQKAQLPGLKADVRPGLQPVHSPVAQDVALRRKSAEVGGRQRLTPSSVGSRRARSRLPAVSWQRAPRLADVSAVGQRRHTQRERQARAALEWSRVGKAKIILHRPLEGTPKTATIRRTAMGQWFVIISYEWEPAPLPATRRQVGIEVGLAPCATRSDGQTIANPRFFGREERALTRARSGPHSTPVRSAVRWSRGRTSGRGGSGETMRISSPAALSTKLMPSRSKI